VQAVSNGVPVCGPDEILAAVAAQRSAIERLLVELVATPTLLGSERGGQEVMLRAFAELELPVRELSLDPAALRAHPGASPFSWDVSAKHNVVADWGPVERQGGRSLILNGHIDVVSAEPADMWASPPFVARREGDWLYGRGAGDMKAGLAAIVGAVAALRALGLEPLSPVQLQSVVEEECTGNGALQCVLDGSRADAVIVTEPTGLAIQASQVGVLWFQVKVRGRPAHAGDAPTGRNSIEASFAVIGALRELEAELNDNPPAPYDTYEQPIKLNVGMIRGGDWASTVAAQTVLHCRIAHYPGGSVDELKRMVEAKAATALSPADGFEVAVGYDGFACEGYTLDFEAPLVVALRSSATQVTGTEPPVFASTATTDARLFHLYGSSPAVCFGPHAENIHAIDERVLLPSVVATAQSLALFIADWCGLAAR
jgi:acetylornithine deacetylase